MTYEEVLAGARNCVGTHCKAGAVCGGREGVETYVEKIGTELRDTMFMCGAGSLQELRPEMVCLGGRDE